MGRGTQKVWRRRAAKMSGANCTPRKGAVEPQSVSLPSGRRLGRVGKGTQHAGPLAPGLPCLMGVGRHQRAPALERGWRHKGRCVPLLPIPFFSSPSNLFTRVQKTASQSRGAG